MSPPGFFPEGQRRSLASFLASSLRARESEESSQGTSRSGSDTSLVSSAFRPYDPAAGRKPNLSRVPENARAGSGTTAPRRRVRGDPPAKPRTRRLLRGHSRLWGPQVPRAPEALSFKAVDTASQPCASRRCGDALPDVCDWRGNVQLTREGDRAPATFYSAFRRPN